MVAVSRTMLQPVHVQVHAGDSSDTGGERREGGARTPRLCRGVGDWIQRQTEEGEPEH